MCIYICRRHSSSRESKKQYHFENVRKAVAGERTGRLSLAKQSLAAHSHQEIIW